MADKNDAALRRHIVELLTLGHAHATFEQAVKDLPVELRGKVPKGAEHFHPNDKDPSSGTPGHSPWQLLEHLRLAQWDILDFSRNPKYQALKWPDGYWPKEKAPADEKAWDKSVRGFKKDLKEMVALVEDPKTDLFAKIPHGDGQTILREALLVADHNAYHIGQLVLVRKMLGAWG
jgi:DinB superfamily